MSQKDGFFTKILWQYKKCYKKLAILIHISSESFSHIFSSFCLLHLFKWDSPSYLDLHNLSVHKDNNVTFKKCVKLDNINFRTMWKVSLILLIWSVTDIEFCKLVSMLFYLEDSSEVFIMVKLLRERAVDGEPLSRHWWWL